MTNAEVLKLVKSNPTEIAKMEALIDPASFSKIKAYHDLDNSFNRIFNVPVREQLAMIAAFFVMNKEGTQDTLIKLIDNGSIQVVDDVTFPGKENLLVKISDVAPDALCYVIALPPVFLIHITDKKYE